MLNTIELHSTTNSTGGDVLMAQATIIATLVKLLAN